MFEPIAHIAKAKTTGHRSVIDSREEVPLVWIDKPQFIDYQLRAFFKVVVVEFFQLWCPGCKSFSLPLLKRWEGTFASEIADKKLVMLSIHTVFEGHDYQTPKRLREFLKERGIKRLVGVDQHRNGSEIPETMRRFRTRGTPEMAIIDKHGNIRFQFFGGFDTEPVEKFIHKLLDEPFQVSIK